MLQDPGANSYQSFVGGAGELTNSPLLSITCREGNAALSHETLIGKFVRKKPFIISRKYPSKPGVTKCRPYLLSDYVGVIRSLNEQ